MQASKSVSGASAENAFTQERAYLAQETIKYLLTIFDGSQGLAEVGKLANQFLKGEFSKCLERKPAQKAEFYRLKAQAHVLLGDVDGAQECFLRALEHNRTSAKAWLGFAELHNALCEQEEPGNQEEAKGISESRYNALLGYMNSCKFALQKSRFVVPKIFELLASGARDAKLLERGFATIFEISPCWVWIFWIP